MRLRGRFRKTKHIEVAEAQAIYDSASPQMVNIAQEVEKLRKELVAKDPLYSILFLDRTAQNYEENVDYIIANREMKREIDIEKMIGVKKKRGEKYGSS